MWAGHTGEPLAGVVNWTALVNFVMETFSHDFNFYEHSYKTLEGASGKPADWVAFIKPTGYTRKNISTIYIVGITYNHHIDPPLLTKYRSP